MEQVDFAKLLAKVDEGYCSWRKPSVLLFGGSDPFVDAASAFSFLDSKRTNMKALNVAAKVCVRGVIRHAARAPVGEADCKCARMPRV